MRYDRRRGIHGNRVGDKSVVVLTPSSSLRVSAFPLQSLKCLPFTCPFVSDCCGVGVGADPPASSTRIRPRPRRMYVLCEAAGIHSFGRIGCSHNTQHTYPSGVRRGVISVTQVTVGAIRFFLRIPVREQAVYPAGVYCVYHLALTLACYTHARSW